MFHLAQMTSHFQRLVMCRAFSADRGNILHLQGSKLQQGSHYGACSWHNEQGSRSAASPKQGSFSVACVPSWCPVLFPSILAASRSLFNSLTKLESWITCLSAHLLSGLLFHHEHSSCLCKYSALPESQYNLLIKGIDCFYPCTIQRVCVWLTKNAGQAQTSAFPLRVFFMLSCYVTSQVRLIRDSIVCR